MQEVFEKIKQKLEEKSWWTSQTYDEDGYGNDDSDEVITLDEAIEIVDQVAEEYKGGWIPCSERLPEEYGEYLYTDINEEVHEGCFAPYGGVLIGGWSTCHADGVVRLSDDKVIAWQPLPAPPKKEV